MHIKSVIYLSHKLTKIRRYPAMPRPKGSKNKVKATKVTADFAAQIAAKQEEKAAEASKKAEAEDVLKKLLASGVSANEILEKLK